MDIKNYRTEAYDHPPIMERIRALRMKNQPKVE